MKFIVFSIALLFSAAHTFAAPKAITDDTISGSFSGSQSMSTVCKNSSCTSQLKSTVSFSHVMKFPEDREPFMHTNTTVSITLSGEDVHFLLGEDPSFQDGDKSAQIEKTFIDRFGVPEMPVTLKLKWGNGKVTLNLTGKAALSEEGGAALSAKSPKAAPNTVDSETLIIANGELIAGGYPVFGADEKFTVKQITTSQGDVNSLLRGTIKSKFILEP